MENREFERDECARIAPHLMELFDGEADEKAARHARAHLLVCPNCSRSWFEWNRQRAFLRNQHVPAPPPTLFWRILVACRLEAKSQQAAKRAWYWPFGAQHATPHQAVKPVVEKSVLSDFEPHQPPADLSARILAQTTRSAAAAERFAPIAPVRSRPRFATWSALAVPAMAAWLLSLNVGSLQSFTTTPVALETETVTPTVRVAEKPVVRRAVNKTVALPAPVKVAAPKPVVVKAAPKEAPKPVVVPVEAEAVVVKPEPRVVKVESKPVEAEREVKPVREVRVEPVEAPQPKRLVVVPKAEAPKPVSAKVEVKVATIPAKTVVIARTVEVKAKVDTKAAPSVRLASAKIEATKSKVARPLPVRLAALNLDDVDPVRARPASLNTSATLPPRRVLPAKVVGTSTMRVSRPALTHALRAETTVPVVDEAQVEEMRDVVNSFRAAMWEDESESVDLSDMG